VGIGGGRRPWGDLDEGEEEGEAKGGMTKEATSQEGQLFVDVTS
jgi:hypothetical protein